MSKQPLKDPHWAIGGYRLSASQDQSIWSIVWESAAIRRSGIANRAKAREIYFAYRLQWSGKRIRRTLAYGCNAKASPREERTLCNPAPDGMNAITAAVPSIAPSRTSLGVADADVNSREANRDQHVKTAPMPARRFTRQMPSSGEEERR